MPRATGTEGPIDAAEVPSQSWQVGELEATRRRLGAAAGAHRLGVALIDVAPGARLTPPHVHADEDEVFLVLGGDGLSWQSSGGRDARTYRVTEGDVLVHPAGGDAHTLIAGDRGLSVLVLAEGSRSGITYLPRTRTFWLGPRWVPADGPSPFAVDAEAGPLPVPEPVDERPRSIVALSECPEHRHERGRYATTYRDAARDAGSERLVLAVDDLDPGARTCPRHWHTVREECFYVLGGTGTAVVGETEHPLRAGSFLLRPPGSQVPHAIDAGPDGLRYVTMGDLVAGDVCVYPDSGKAEIAPGLMVRTEAVDCFVGEPDATI